MPKTSSKDRINAAFEEIAEALNNPKMRERCLNGNKENEIVNELVEIFNKRKSHNNPIAHVTPRVSHHTKTPYVPARVNHIDSIPENRTQDRRQSKKKTEHVHKQTVTGMGKGKRKSAKIKIPEPLTHYQNKQQSTNYSIKNIGKVE